MRQASLMVRMSMAVALCGLAAGCEAAADTNSDTLKIGARHGNRELAGAFLAFLHSTDGQRILVEYGFRPVGPETTAAVNDFNLPIPAGVFTMADLGAWDAVEDAVYGPAGIWTSIFASQAKGR